MPNPPGMPLFLDGKAYVYPRGELRPVNQLRQAEFVAGNMMPTMTGVYDGDGLPVVMDAYSFELPWELDDNFRDLETALRVLRTAGGVHTLALKTIREPYTYALRAGQATFWLPRGDAAAQDFAAGVIAPADVSVPQSTAPTPTVVYKPSVASGDAVPAGEVWISSVVSRHPSGKYAAFCKLGTAPTARWSMLVTFCLLFRILVRGMARQEPHAGTAIMTLMAVETN